MRIAINARLPLDGSVGGVEQFVTSLIRALGSLTDGDEEYLIVTYPESAPALAECLGPRQRVVVQADGSWRDRLRRRLGKWGDRLGDCSRAVRYRLWGNAAVALQGTPGFFESLDVDVVHFPFQQFEPTALPSLYNPHDLQHRHLPQFFSPAERAERDAIYGTGCRLATAIAAESAFVRDDLVQQYSVPASKVFVVPRGSPLASGTVSAHGSELRAVRDKYRLPSRFVLFPAQFWPHKNHRRLLDALRLIRARHGVDVPLVCTGRHNHCYRELKVGTDQDNLPVLFPGYIPASDLIALYRLSDFLVFPSLFEGGGFPVMEAFAEGTPVLCSNTTALPEYAGEAALMFDPTCIENIAETVWRLWDDGELRRELREKGLRRIKEFSWDITARTYRSLYRKITGHHRVEADLALPQRY